MWNGLLKGEIHSIHKHRQATAENDNQNVK